MESNKCKCDPDYTINGKCPNCGFDYTEAKLEAYLTKDNFKIWLEKAVDGVFMNLFFYDRKNCEDMSTEMLASFEKKGIITKELLIEVFTKQIEKEFIKKPDNGI